MTKAEAFKVLSHIYCMKAETVAECEAVGMAMDSLEQPEQKKGKWVRDEFGSKCLCCGSYACRNKFGEPWESDFCPKCGADMRGENADEMQTELETLKDAIQRGLLIPVIRCENCIYWDDQPFVTATPDFHKCKRIAYHASTADGYCDRAERREKTDAEVH